MRLKTQPKRKNIFIIKKLFNFKVKFKIYHPNFYKKVDTKCIKSIQQHNSSPECSLTVNQNWHMLAIYQTILLDFFYPIKYILKEKLKIFQINLKFSKKDGFSIMNDYKNKLEKKFHPGMFEEYQQK